jgi:hypothetical protein
VTQGLVAAGDTDGHDGRPGACGDEHRPVVERLDVRSELSRPFGEEDQGLTPTQHLFGQAHRLTIRGVAIHGERAEAHEQFAKEGMVIETVFGHEKDLARGDE